jgi:hypothetical protein
MYDILTDSTPRTSSTIWVMMLKIITGILIVAVATVALTRLEAGLGAIPAVSPDVIEPF